MKQALLFFLVAGGFYMAVAGQGHAQSLEDSSKEYIREELGVNEYTTPSIAWLMKELDKFRPIPMEVVDREHWDKVFSNRLQTSLHFGSIIADGFIIVTDERRSDIENIGRSLLRQAKALGVGKSLTRRSNKLLELGAQGDWASLRSELVGTQKDVESAMMELHDEQVAHMISLGGWLRGFYAGTVVTMEHYSVERANVLKNVEIIDYFIDRLDTLNPRLKKTQFVTEITSRLKTIRKIAAEAQESPLTQSQVGDIRKLAEEINRILLSKVDADGNIHG